MNLQVPNQSGMITSRFILHDLAKHIDPLPLLYFGPFLLAFPS